MRSFGVYKIQIGDKCYVGSTGTTFRQREVSHMALLRKGTHSNKKMQAAFDEFKKATFEILEKVLSETEATIAEQKWINTLNPELNQMHKVKEFHTPKLKGVCLPPVRVDESFFEQTKQCADAADEFLSVYIRKAIKERNAKYNQDKIPMDKIREVISGIKTTCEEIREEKPAKPTIPELKEKVKQMECKQVQTFQKGGK